MEDSKDKRLRFDEAAPTKRHSKPESPIVAACTTSLQVLPNQVLERIVRQVVVVVEGHRSGLRILPLVSRTLLSRLQDLSLAVGYLHGAQALSALQLRRLAADGKRAWSLHTLDLRDTRVHMATFASVEQLNGKMLEARCCKNTAKCPFKPQTCCALQHPISRQLKDSTS